MRIPMRVLMGHWQPQQCRVTGYLPGEGIMPYLTETYHSTRIQVGTIVVHPLERTAQEVVEVREYPEDLWPEKYQKAFADYLEAWERQASVSRHAGEHPERSTWDQRPLNLVMRPADQPSAEPSHWTVRGNRPFYVLPEHYSVCRLCNEIPPCNHVTTEAMVDHEMANTERLMAIPAGCCLGCGEPITSRMKAVRFPGPNLWRPDWGTDSAVFHARENCSGSVSFYRQQWQEKGHDELQPELPEGDA
ncbi:hypothetical protein [Streptomyces sp. AS02]|uniref:hypothetical protein n=1 Tax=Streptomyces sp. AS02 TaxID=2938946 RepID=UPI00201FC7FE|nr:hypothetical protein [Streptomyces sp. AS02]MCL8016896.1 hypothetical protein [Streptomyces sp. AS02]